MHNMLRLQWMRRVLPLAFLAGSGFCLMATSATCLAQQLDHPAATKSTGETAHLSPAKFEEIGLQFFVVVVLGGLLSAHLSHLRDSKIRKESDLASLRDLIMQVDDLYRSSKQTKRMIRSRLKQSVDVHEINAKFFAARMEELSNTQLKLEQIRNAIRTRHDLFDEETQRRMLEEIQYSEGYLHDVVREFETRKVSWSAAGCCISSSCDMLMDFLGESRIPEEVQDHYKDMRDASATVERFSAFKSIIRKMKEIDSSCKKYRRVSDGCMLLVIREMRDIVLERQGRPEGSAAFVDLVRRFAIPR